MPAEARRVLPGREGGGGGAARPGGVSVSARAWRPSGVGRSPAPPGRPGARPPAPAQRSAWPAPAPLQPREGEAQGASAKSEELNKELGIRAGAAAPIEPMAIPTLGAPRSALACAQTRLGSAGALRAQGRTQAARAFCVTRDLTHFRTIHTHTSHLGGEGGALSPTPGQALTDAPPSNYPPLPISMSSPAPGLIQVPGHLSSYFCKPPNSQEASFLGTQPGQGVAITP